MNPARFMPNVGDLVFIGVCQLLLYMRPNYLYSDGSTGWHLVSGDFILKTNEIPRTDLFSYTMQGKPWVAYEWLSDLLMSGLDALGGLPLLATAVAVAIAGLVLALYQRMRSEGCHFALALLFSIVGLIASANHWLVRPHIFTFWGLFIFYTRLEDYYRGKITATRLFAWLLPVMLVWVNTHPAFLFGFAVCGLYLCATVCSAMAEADRSMRLKQSGAILAVLLGCVLVSFANPYGIQLYSYIRDYLHGTSILAVTDEFKSPDFKSSIHAVFLELLFAFTALGFYLRGRLTLPTLGMLVAFGHLALSAVRNISLFAIVSLPALGALFARPRGFAPGSVLDGLIQRLKKATSEFDAQEKISDLHLLPLVYAILVSMLAIFHLPGAPTSTFDPETAPVATLDYIREHKLDAAHGFNLDNWGGIIRYKLGMPVFIDDRADFYGEKFYGEYGRVCEVKEGWRDALDKRKIDWVLFPRESQLAQALSRQSDWQKASEDGASVLYTRKP